MWFRRSHAKYAMDGGNRERNVMSFEGCHQRSRKGKQRPSEGQQLDELAGPLPTVIDRLTPQGRLPDGAVLPPRQ